MKLHRIDCEFSLCQVVDFSQVDLTQPYWFLCKTDEECSLVCPTPDVPANATACDHGWRAFRVQGPLDFSLIGILAELSALLAAEGIGIFAISTYNTDYLLTRSENYERALQALARAGHSVT